MPPNTLPQILDLARWAPSGDNTQPWRFEIVGDTSLLVHGHDTREYVVYDFDGHPSHMAHGALLETIRLAATRFGLSAEWTIRPNQPESAPIYEVTFRPTDEQEDPLVQFIEKRTVQRRVMRTSALTSEEREALTLAVGERFSLRILESLGERFAIARLLWNNAYLRLTCPEAFIVHREIIEWNTRFSMDKIPDQAVGVDPFTAKLMHWVMKDWKRVELFNRFLMGTIVPRIQLDFLPALSCAAHILLLPTSRPSSLTEYLNAGVALQRLWLTATSLGLHLQPEMTPIIFRWYARSGREISASPEINKGIIKLADQLDRQVSVAPDEDVAFLCRVGHSKPPVSRSLRKSLRSLMRESA